MKNKLYLILFLSVVMLLGCKNRNNSENVASVKNVKTAFPELVSDVNVRTFPGVVKVASEINLGFKTAGQLTKIYVKEGDFVREGDIIAELDTKDYLLQVQATQIQYDQLKTEVERLAELYKRNSIPANDYEKATSGLKALGVMLQAHKNTIEYCTLRSPVSGYIQTINFAKSEMVNAGTAVVSLIDVSTVKIETEIPAALYLMKNDFIKYSCKTNLIQNKIIPLKFVGVNRKSNSSQLFKMSFVPSSNSKLEPGMNVEVMISMNEKTAKTIYSLPAKAVFYENEKSYIWVVVNNEVKKREITTGEIIGNGNILVLSGINETDQVVTAGIRVLHENDKVKVIPEASKSNVGSEL